MITVITSKGNTQDAQFDLRFGRGAYFCIYNHETNSTEFIKNKFSDAQGGAGTKVAEQMVEMGVSQVISGDFGPKAKDLLEKFKIQMIAIQEENATIASILNKVKQ